VDAAVADFAAKLSGEIPGIYRREAPDRPRPVGNLPLRISQKEKTLKR
jgi:hypothetical protein